MSRFGKFIEDGEQARRRPVQTVFEPKKSVSSGVMTSVKIDSETHQTLRLLKVVCGHTSYSDVVTEAVSSYIASLSDKDKGKLELLRHQ